jgi:aspartyl-tRNA(Asn)/glutamyl-tRNA(Gln) amidotransferase subunit A
MGKKGETGEHAARLQERIEEGRDHGAFLELNPSLLEEAQGVDRKVREGRGGKLAGRVVAVKANINVRGLRASCASRTLEGYVSPYDATVIERIRAEDGLILGMTNMDEFACGSSGETSAFGPTQNPAAPGRIPGGSSSGSAAAVAAGLCDIALGSDTGGSIRNPASHCGVLGLKPTYGLVPRYGLIDLAMSFDQIGPFARRVEDLALLLEVIAGPNPRECTTLDIAPPEYRREMNREIEGYRIGYARQFEDFTDPAITAVVKRSLDRLESLGAEVVEIDLPNLGRGLSAYYLIVFVEFFSATRKFDGRRYGKRIEEVCGEEVLRRILLGRYISQKEYSGKYYQKALRLRTLLRRELLGALEGIDLIAGPTVPKLPHEMGEEVDPLSMYGYDLLTVPANLAGIPAGVIPAGEVEGIPVGLQLQGKRLEEGKVLNVMAALEGEER